MANNTHSFWHEFHIYLSRNQHLAITKSFIYGTTSTQKKRALNILVDFSGKIVAAITCWNIPFFLIVKTLVFLFFFLIAAPQQKTIIKWIENELVDWMTIWKKKSTSNGVAWNRSNAIKNCCFILVFKQTWRMYIAWVRLSSCNFHLDFSHLSKQTIQHYEICNG